MCGIFAYFFPSSFDLVMETPIIKKVHFPNLVLGYGTDTEEGSKYKGMYKWTVEYQCIEKAGVSVYVGFNIYHRDWNPPASDVAEIKQVVEDAGLGQYWNTSIKPMGGPHCNYTSS